MVNTALQSTDLKPSHFMNLRGFRYHYVDEGKGEPIVMVHGNPTWSYYYRHAIKALKNNYRTLAPDHLGCGLSDKPKESEYEFRLQDRVDDLKAFIDQLGLKQITLMLHDWGGMIGMAYAVEHPENIKRLIISNTSAFPLPASKPFPTALKFARDFRLGSFLVRYFGAFSHAANHFCTKIKRLDKQTKQAYLAPYNDKHSRLAVLRFVQDIPLKPTDPSYDLVHKVGSQLHRLQHIPMLIVWGAKDFVFDDHFLAQWKIFFPKAEVHRYGDAGHYLLEDKGEEVIAVIKTFLSSTP